MPYCAECGGEVRPNAVVCLKCGCQVKGESAAAVPSGQLAAFYIGGVIIPVIGWVGAIYLLVKGQVGHAIGVGALSVLAACFWVGLSQTP